MAAPASIVEQHLKTLTDNSISLENKFSTTCEIVRKLGSGDQETNIISISDKLMMYGWFKVATKAPLPASKPSFFAIEASNKWNEHDKILNKQKLTPEQCMQKYIEFIINVLKKYPKEVTGILQPTTQPKKSGFSFGSKPKTKPTDTKAEAEAAAAAAQKLVLLSAAGNTAGAHSAPVLPTPAPAPLVAGKKSASDPSDTSTDKKKAPDVSTLT
jgi:acyl-CoA-binding protein